MPTSPRSPGQKPGAAKGAAKPTTSKTASAKQTTGRKATPAKTAAKPTTSKAAPTTKTSTGATKATGKPSDQARKPAPSSAGKPRPALKAPTKAVARAPRASKSPAIGKAGTSRTTTAKTTGAEKKAASATRSRYWARAQGQARKVLRSREQLIEIAKQGDKVAAKIKSGPMSRLIEQLKALLRLIRAYATGEYRDVSWESMILIVAAVIYVVSPLDLIPDFIPVIGYLDDVTVVSFALKIVRDELDEYLAWERETGRAPKSRRSPA